MPPSNHITVISAAVTYVSEGGSDADCFWHRVTDFTGSGEVSLVVELGGRREVDILPTDGGFITVECGTWTLESAAPSNT